ncbi:hypothetical protein EDB86DRAFT_1810317 [Lactarius hatsudake]|nr:hypothetical protein EDB86DRAFT_1810317 [Lactarius hatsudake]
MVLYDQATAGGVSLLRCLSVLYRASPRPFLGGKYACGAGRYKRILYNMNPHALSQGRHTFCWRDLRFLLYWLQLSCDYRSYFCHVDLCLPFSTLSSTVHHVSTRSTFRRSTKFLLRRVISNDLLGPSRGNTNMDRSETYCSIRLCYTIEGVTGFKREW